MMDLGWILLGVAIVIGTLGLFNSVIIIISIIIFLFGSLLSIRWIFSSESDHFWISIHRSQLPIYQTSLPKLMESMPSERESENEKVDRRITGSRMIDDQLESMIQYFIRDFIMSWYPAISHDARFICQFRQSLQQMLISISNRCKSMDWVVYLTTRLVEDISVHLRLFREAKTSSRSKDGSSSKVLVDHFFDKEADKEKDVCRDDICLKPNCEKDYLSDLAELILYFILPDDDFANTPIRSAIVEILVSLVLLPLINQLSDPDYINSLIVWACAGIPVSSEIFLNVMKMTTMTDELEEVRKQVFKEISRLRSRDSGGREEGNELRQQIRSLEYLKETLDARLARLNKRLEMDSVGMSLRFNYRKLERSRLYQLPLDAILKNSVTLDRFLQYMDSVNCQHYVNLYLNIECWKASVSERLCALQLEKIHHESSAQTESPPMPGIRHDYFSAHDLSAHKAEAEVMYEQYLSEKANPRVIVEDSIVKRLIPRLRFENLSETWFDEVQSTIFNLLKDADIFLPAFKRSIGYIRLLAEMDLLRDPSRSDEEDSQSFEDVCINYLDQGDECDGSIQGGSCGSSLSGHSPQPSLNPSPGHSRASSLSNKHYTLTSEIIGTEIVREGSKSYASYKVKVQKKDTIGQEAVWNVWRRYSEFHDFYSAINATFADLSSINFPSKKMLNNLAPWFLEKRKKELNSWINKLLEAPTLQTHPGLLELISKFLEPSTYQAMQLSGNLAKKVSDAVKSVPDTVFNTVDEVVDGLYKRLLKTSQPRVTQPNNQEFCSRGSVDVEGDENLPLKILLPLMDEVFDLRCKDQWLRRRLVLFLRQILKAMFGDIVNRRIVEYVGYITSPLQVTDYIKTLKDSIWPNGKLTTGQPERSMDMKLRTKVTARMCMLASISDEFRAILGSQTTNKGIFTVYECVQWQALNKRLLYVLLNGIIEGLLSNHSNVPALLRSLATNSSRISNRNQPMMFSRTKSSRLTA